MRIGVVLAVLLAAEPAVAQGSDAATRRAQEEAQRYLRACETLDEAKNRECEGNRTLFLRTYQAAKSGDYQAQRNVSTSLSINQSGIGRNMLQACAWALVTLHSGHARADESDVFYVRVRCGHQNVDRAAAEARAEAIMTEVRRAPARMPPEPRTARHVGPLITTSPDPNED